MLRVGGILQSSLVNGPGARYVIFASGCNHDCYGCHNTPLQDYNYGKYMTIEDLTYDVVRYHNSKIIKGVTLSGGEPFDQAAAFEDLIYNLIHSGIDDIWIYTGYTYEEAIGISPYLIENASVLVDGKFDISKKDDTLRYRGSSNQRIIDLKATFSSNELVLINDSRKA